MGCQTKVLLGDSLVFGICTHDPDTGVLTDADSSPTYRVYEEETTTPILGGKMGKLDDTNTTGFYTAQLACTTRNGFEVSKTYTIYIEVIVDSDTGGMCYAFRVKPAYSSPDWFEIEFQGSDLMSGLQHHARGKYRNI